MSYMFLNKMLYGVRPITNIHSLSPFFYGGIPLGLLPFECQKELDLKAPPVQFECQKELDLKAQPLQVPVTFECQKELDLKAQPVPLIEKPPVKPKSRWLPPDSLFWNLFIAVYGESEFLQIGSKFANREWEEKNHIRQEIAKNPKNVQTTNHKVSMKNVQEMMSEYMTGVGVTTLLGLIGLSVYYKINIHLVDPVKKTHLSFLPTNTDKEACFLILRERRYELSSEPIPLDDSFGLESYTRPLRAISTYKRPELEDIRRRFNIDVSDSSKEAVYRALSEYLVWK